jgi:hypothetical protein
VTKLSNLVYGSKHSLNPRIWLVEAVGIGARRREFLRPVLEILSFNEAQSHSEVGVTPQRSY